MKILLGFYLVCLLLPGPCLAAPENADLLVRRTPVPAEPPYQGEVRLLRRDSELVLQTILSSKVLRHVVMMIGKKEAQEWPQDREGSIDSRRYSDELFRAYEAVRDGAGNLQAKDDRSLQMLIEFVLEGADSYVRFYAVSLTREGEHFSIAAKELLRELKISYHYGYNNMLAILCDSFHLDRREARELLQPATGGP